MPPPHAATVQEVLAQRGLVSREEIDRVGSQLRGGEWFIDRVVAEGLVAEEQVAHALADELGYPYVALALDQVDADLVRRAPADLLRRARALPLIDTGSDLEVAFADPTDLDEIGAIEKAFNREVRPAVATSSAIRAALREVIGPDTGAAGAEARDEAWEASGTLRLYGALLSCVQSGGEDLFLVPTPAGGALRVRAQGLVRTKEDLTPSDYQAVLARLRSLVSDGSGAEAFRRAVLPTTIGGRALRLTIGLAAALEGATACIHLEPAADGQAPAAGLPDADVRALRAFLRGEEGLLVVNDERLERAAGVLSSIIGEESPRPRCVAVVARPSALVDGALHLCAPSFAGGLDEAVSAALALEPDVLLVEMAPGQPAPARALLAAGRGRRVVLLDGWATAAETVLALRRVGLPPGAVEARLRWVLTLGRGETPAVLVATLAEDAARLAAAHTPADLESVFHARTGARTGARAEER